MLLVHTWPYEAFSSLYLALLSMLSSLDQVAYSLRFILAN